MGRIWNEESKYATWLRVELAVCEAYTRRGRIPAEALARVRAKARVDVARILEIQRRGKHEKIAPPTPPPGQPRAGAPLLPTRPPPHHAWGPAPAPPPPAAPRPPLPPPGR